MLDLEATYDHLRRLGFGNWPDLLDQTLRAQVSDDAHGDMHNWRAALASLPAVHQQSGEFNQDAIGVPSLKLDAGQSADARTALATLSPWRKGPFDIGGIVIDSEWRSELKWQRIAAAMPDLKGLRILDVGCGNGYYALRMRGAGADAVIGIDPTLLFIAQHLAIRHFLTPEPVCVLPLRLEDLPIRTRAFDVAFSMGVLYHSRAPIDHLRQLRDALRQGGTLVLETIVLPDATPLSRTPTDRYARMRNVWHLPSVPELLIWLERAGFRGAEVTDVSRTTSDEQRTTEWMPFESLADALAPDDPGLTIEGWPAPERAIIVARTPTR